MNPPRASKRPKLDRSTDLLRIPNEAIPSVLIVNKKAPPRAPHTFRVGESKLVSGVKDFLDDASQQDQSTGDINVEVVSEGEAYIEITLGLVPLEEEDTDELSDRSDSDRSDYECSETSCEDLKLPGGRYIKKCNENNSKLIEEIENK